MAHEHDPLAIFSQACNWAIAMQVLTDAFFRQGIRQTGIPSVLCSAFSVELLLKCLVTIETGITPMGHDLKRLFEKVSPTSQARIRNFFDIYGDKERQNYEVLARARSVPFAEPFGFDWALNTSRDCYTRYRYTYELNVKEGSVGGGWTANLIGDGTMSVILELRPEWWHLVPTSQAR